MLCAMCGCCCLQMVWGANLPVVVARCVPSCLGAGPSTGRHRSCGITVQRRRGVVGTAVRPARDRFAERPPGGGCGAARRSVFALYVWSLCLFVCQFGCVARVSPLLRYCSHSLLSHSLTLALRTRTYSYAHTLTRALARACIPRVKLVLAVNAWPTKPQRWRTVCASRPVGAPHPRRCLRSCGRCPGQRCDACATTTTS